MKTLSLFLWMALAVPAMGLTNGPAPPPPTAPMVLRSYPVIPAFLMPLATRDGTTMDIPDARLKAFFVSHGMPFPEGSAIEFLPVTSTLSIRNTPENLEMFERVLWTFNVIPLQVRVTVRVREIRAELSPEHANLEGFDGLERQMVANGQIADVWTATVTAMSGGRASVRLDRGQEDGAAARISGTLDAGVLVGSDGYTVCLDLRAKIRFETAAPREVFEKEIDTPCVLWDGQSFRWWMDAAPPAAPAASTKRPRRYVSIHVCVVDPAGGPVRAAPLSGGEAHRATKERHDPAPIPHDAVQAGKGTKGDPRPDPP